MMRVTFCLAVSALFLAPIACSKPAPVAQVSDTVAAHAPTVLKVESRSVASPGPAALRLQDLKRQRLARASGVKTSAAFANPTASPVVSSLVTFEKSAILNRVFLYGSDLQYSSIGENDGMLLQSLSIGHVTARFQILGDRLQLMAEEKYRFESNINIPLRLLHEWPITAQTSDHLTVDIATASPALAGLFGSENPANSSWVRSVEFVPQGSYLLIESSVELADGSVAEFMESVFPRETLVGQAPAPLFDDATIEPLADRFGFLSNTVWKTLPQGRTKTAVAQRFLSPEAGKTIDWYVTPNIPAEFIPAVRDGIEGWNRYSQKMWGRDFIKFKGILPAGIKIGDPRFNVVNWDSVLDASAAYESQASDPETGIQSHSLIYLPYAWVAIGRDFWEKGQITQDRTATLKASLEKTEFLGKKVDVRCFNEGELAAISPKMKEDPETFSKSLLRGVLFHEVGHALGLAHNFKGSLEWDLDDASTLFTTSIMEYNQYQIEGAGFDGPGVATGPLLEYDRQILSVLYNDAKDLSATDRLIPHCDDRAADSKIGGVDPLCIRYDAGKDPSETLVRTMALIQDPKAALRETKSLAVAAERSVALLGDPAEITSEMEVRLYEAAFQTHILGLVQYYVSAGAQGLNYMMSANLRNLATYRAGTLPSTMDGLAMRERIASTMDQVMALENFSPATRTAFEKIGDQTTAWLKKTAWYANAAQAEQTEHETKMRGAALEALQLVERLVMPRVRIRQIQGLARSAAAPFYLNSSVDYEVKALNWLEQILVGSLPSGASYSGSERVAAAQTLATFKTIPQAAAIQVGARSKVETEITKATSAEERESLRALLNFLK